MSALPDDVADPPPRVGVMAAMDKFRGTASARALSDVVARAVDRQGCASDAQPMSDGGEGFREVFDGVTTIVNVAGPLGDVVQAGVTLRHTLTGVVGFIEVAEAAGRDYVRSPSSDEALATSSVGVGQLILAASQLGAERIVIGCGGSATSDGGLGCYQVLRDAGGLPVPVVAATDVRSRFLDARNFAEQKGVSAADLHVVDLRLNEARALYVKEQGVDVELLDRSGAAGGIAGALAALGGVLTSGFDAVADAVGLRERIARSSLVVTGEGRFDLGSLEGKVIIGIAGLTDHAARLLVVCGEVVLEALDAFERHYPNAKVVSLSDRYGVSAAMSETLNCVDEVVTSEVLDFLKT
ncbi:MAG TPA: glycerate kinase [Acidimicrobiales bacterium]